MVQEFVKDHISLDISLLPNYYSNQVERYVVLSSILIATMSFAKVSLDEIDNSVIDVPTKCEQVELLTSDLLGKVILKEKKEMCFSQNMVVAVSKNCQKECKLINLAMNFKKSLPYKKVGTPASWLCENLGGIHVVRFLSVNSEMENKNKIHFCQLKDDLVSDNILIRNQGLSIKK